VNYDLLLQQRDEDLNRDYQMQELDALKRVQQRLNRQQTYRSVTTWQGEPEWEIQVLIDGFLSIQKAAEFGQKVKALKHVRNAEYLVLIDGEENRYRIEQHQIRVRIQTQDSRGKMVVNWDDFEPIDVNIKDFSSVDGLDTGFGSLSYGVEDEHDQFVSTELWNLPRDGNPTSSVQI